MADAVVADMVARGYVDDRAFAAAWAGSRARDRGFGRQRLRQELVARGIDRPLVEAAIQHAFEETDERTRAELAATRRLAGLRRDAPEQAMRRLHDYLRRRGYPGDVVRQVLRALRTDGLLDAVSECEESGETDTAGRVDGVSHERRGS